MTQPILQLSFKDTPTGTQPILQLLSSANNQHFCKHVTGQLS